MKLRHIEVYEIFSKVKGLADGEYTSLRSTLRHKDLEAWKSTFISDSVLLTGHSLGGATSVSDHVIGFHFTRLAQKDCLAVYIVESAAIWAFASANPEMRRVGSLA